MSNYERQLAFFIDANIPEWYIDTGDPVPALLAANVKSISYGELVRASIQLTDGTPRFDDETGNLLNPWTQFAGSAATSEIVIDNNWNWWDSCKLHSAITAGTAISTIQISNLSAVPRALGTLRLSASDVVHYNAYSVSGGNYTFQLADSSFDTATFTPSASYAAGDPVRLIEMPVIVSAQNSATPATGYFEGVLDAANPVYETLIEGSSAISGTRLEFSIYLGGRVIFRARCIFDCLSAISPGEGTNWIRPNIWAEADSRYLQFENLALTASSLPYGSAPTATPTTTGEVLTIAFGIPAGKDGTDGTDGVTPHIDPVTKHWMIGETDTGIVAEGEDGTDGITPHIGANGHWYIGEIDTGVAAELSGSYLTFSSVSSNQVTFAGTETLPVAVLTNAGHLYPIEKGSLTVDTVNNTVTLDVTPYLAYDNAASFSGTWRVYFSAGSSDPGDDIATLTSTAVTPKHGAVYVHELAASDSFTISTTGLSADKQITFELHLIQPSTAVSFTLPNTLIWADSFSAFASANSAPDMSTADTLYCIVIRWDGSDLLANLAYTKAVSA